MLRLRLRMARPRFASPAKLLGNQGYSVPASSSAGAMARDPTARDSSATPARARSSEGSVFDLDPGLLDHRGPFRFPTSGSRQARLDPATLHGVVFGILLIRVLVRFRPAGDDIRARQPAVQVDVAAALGTEGVRGRGRGLAADRARFCRSLAGPFRRACARFRLSWHSASRSGSGNPRRPTARSIRRAAAPPHWCRSRPS